MKRGRKLRPPRRPFVGRDALLASLLEHVRQASTGAGRVVFLIGPPGSGRTTLLRTFARKARKRHRGLQAGYADAADPSHSAWIQLANRFTFRQRMVEAAAHIIPEWVDLLPLVGGFAEAVIRTISAIRHRGGDAAEGAIGTGSSVDEVRRLLARGTMKPRLILMDNFEAADAPELSGASALLPHLKRTRTLMVVAAASTGRLRGPVADLLAESERLGLGWRLDIEPLGPTDCVAAVREFTRTAPGGSWAAWFEERGPLTPAALWAAFGELEAQGHVRRERRRWVWAARPPDIGPGAHPEARGLPDVSAEERRILSAAGILGARFPAAPLASALGMSELALDDHLATLARRGLLQYDSAAEHDGELTDIFRFHAPAEAVRWAALLEPEERRRLERLFGR